MQSQARGIFPRSPDDFLLLPSILHLWVLEAAEGASSRSLKGLACSSVPAPFLLVLGSCGLSPLHPPLSVDIHSLTPPPPPHPPTLVLHAEDFWILPWEGMSPN